jgi:hypothetical protein
MIEKSSYRITKQQKAGFCKNTSKQGFFTRKSEKKHYQ